MENKQYEVREKIISGGDILLEVKNVPGVWIEQEDQSQQYIVGAYTKTIISTATMERTAELTLFNHSSGWKLELDLLRISKVDPASSTLRQTLMFPTFADAKRNALYFIRMFNFLAAE